MCFKCESIKHKFVPLAVALVKAVREIHEIDCLSTFVTKLGYIFDTKAERNMTDIAKEMCCFFFLPLYIKA